MKKLIILAILLLILTGCNTKNLYTSEHVDKDTCVVYLRAYQGGITPMYNPDGSLKLDSDCIERK